MFIPPRCPNRRCAAHHTARAGFFVRNGSYRPRARPRPVPRFRCRLCRRYFSRQSFRADRGQKKPYLNATCLRLFVACVGQRQAARVLQVSRRTVERRFRWLARHAAAFLDNHLRRHTLRGPFQLDELESFEANRFQPLTVPVLIDRRTFFVVGTAVGPLRRKGRMTPRQLRLRAAHEALHGRRPSQSPAALHHVLAPLQTLVLGRFDLETDEKPLYGALGRRLFGSRCRWLPHSATRVRNRSNPLFPINHTNARLRHFLSRLRRRTWCVSKTRLDLQRHLRIAALWMNYCRGITNKTRTTPAQALGLALRPLRPEELVAWRQDWGPLSPTLDHT